MELVVTVAIVGVLAAAAVPMAKLGVKRSRELELRRNLRVIRRAVDDFHKSYVASGGSLGLGQPPQAAVPGLGGRPGLGQPPQAGGRPSLPGSPTGTGGGQLPGSPEAAGNELGIPLIDPSQFDPVDCRGYPPDLEVLVTGVQAFGGTPDDKVKFLRRIPKDPMTRDGEWQFCSYQDEPVCRTWGRQNVYDVHSKSDATALDGSKYSEW